jgi:hypothetical protein
MHTCTLYSLSPSMYWVYKIYNNCKVKIKLHRLYQEGPKSQTKIYILRSQLTAYKSLKNRGWSPSIFTEKTINQSIPQSGRHGTVACWEEKK